MSYDGLLLTVTTSMHRYVVRRDQILELRLVTTQADLERPDERGKAIMGSELGPLLDLHDQQSSSRRHALIVPTRRRSVALMVNRIEDIHETLVIHRLPALFMRRLKHSWFLGVVVEHDQPVLVLDLRQIAQDVMLNQGKKE